MTDTEYPFLPLVEFGKEFEITFTLDNKENLRYYKYICQGVEEISDDIKYSEGMTNHLPEKIAYACLTIMGFARHYGIKNRQSIQIGKKVNVHFVKNRKNEIYKISFSP